MRVPHTPFIRYRTYRKEHIKAANAPTRADVVGSFLRPEALKEARAAHAAGTLDDAGLARVENACIAELVAKQKAAGLPQPAAR